MAKQLFATVQKFEIRNPQPSDGLFVTGIWSVTIVTVVGFIMWLLL